MSHRPNARDLRVQSNKRAIIQQYVSDALDAIYIRIEAAHEGDTDKIDFRLSSTFDVPNMTNEDAMLYVHYEIMRDLEKHDYDIEFNEKNCTLYISWGKELSHSVSHDIRTYIASKSINLGESRRQAELRQRRRASQPRPKS
jgi:hypothetical protein